MSLVVASPVVALSSAVAVVGAGDPGSTRLVYAMVAGLAVVGVAFVLLGLWVLRQTRPDLEVLAPLERMGDGDWKKRDPSTQRRILDELRPDGARPLASEPLPPPLDREFEEEDHPVSSFSDLGPGLGAAAQRDPTPPGVDLDFGHEVSDDGVSDDGVSGDEMSDDEVSGDDDEVSDDEVSGDDEEVSNDEVSDDEVSDDEVASAGEISDSGEALSDPRG